MEHYSLVGLAQDYWNLTKKFEPQKKEKKVKRLDKAIK